MLITQPFYYGEFYMVSMKNVVSCESTQNSQKTEKYDMKQNELFCGKYFKKHRLSLQFNWAHSTVFENCGNKQSVCFQFKNNEEQLCLVLGKECGQSFMQVMGHTGQLVGCYFGNKEYLDMAKQLQDTCLRSFCANLNGERLVCYWNRMGDENLISFELENVDEFESPKNVRYLSIPCGNDEGIKLLNSITTPYF